MKVIGLASAAALLAGCSVNIGNASPQVAAAPASPGVATPKERLPTDVRRATIIVRDMEKSLALYRDVIGLQVNYDTTVETSGVALPAGEPGATARLVLLNANDPWV
ncbi:MAG TPA: VOC family protein, partial [Erythrobacter sp.]|nr:VOC family protein [Erythrobacter sp.]